MKSQKVKFEYLENKLIAKICTEKPHPFTLGELYPQVKSIGGNKISPDIDILQRIDTHNLVVGYEIKWLHYFKKSGTSWYRFYQGIGQALCYFLHGVTHAYLVLGWDNLPENDASRVLNYFKILQKFVATGVVKTGLLHTRIPSGLFEAPIYRCLGMIAFNESKIHYVGDDPISLRREDFPIDSIDDEALRNEAQTKRVNLFAKKPGFKWNRSFIQR